MRNVSGHSDGGALRLIIGDRDYLVHGTLLGAPYPQTLSLESTNYCNLCCSHCGHSQYPGFRKGHFDMQYFDKVEHLLRSAIRGISLSNFGEPFVSRTWPEILKRSLSIEGPGIFFITNGLLLNGHIEEVLNPRISMAISMDGASEITYGSFRGRGRFSRLTANLRLLKDAKSKAGVSYPEVTFLFTASRLNCGDLPSVVEMAHSFGVSGIVVQLQNFYDPERFRKESLFFAREEYDRNIMAARKRASELGITLVHPDSFDGLHFILRSLPDNQWIGRDTDGRMECFSQAVISYVKFNGAVEACCTPDHAVMGSLDFDTFEDIWHGPAYRHLRLSLDRGVLPDTCRRCSLLQAIDVHQERAHLIELPNPLAEKSPGPQRYRVMELEASYQEALSLLDRDPAGALRIVEPLSVIDDNLYEVLNLQACLYGLLRDLPAMRRKFRECSSIAPKDPLISHNCAEGR